MTPLRESVLAAVAARLASFIPDVPVERERRAPVAIGDFPRLLVIGTGATPDETQSPLETFWTFGFVVIGYARGDTDLAAAQELSMLHARVAEALQNAELGAASVQPTMRAADLRLYPHDQSEAPAGEFSVEFEALAIAPTAHPYAP